MTWAAGQKQHKRAGRAGGDALRNELNQSGNEDEFDLGLGGGYTMCVCVLCMYICVCMCYIIYLQLTMTYTLTFLSILLFIIRRGREGQLVVEIQEVGREAKAVPERHTPHTGEVRYAVGVIKWV